MKELIKKFNVDLNNPVLSSVFKKYLGEFQKQQSIVGFTSDPQKYGDTWPAGKVNIEQNIFYLIFKIIGSYKLNTFIQSFIVSFNLQNINYYDKPTLIDLF